MYSFTYKGKEKKTAKGISKTAIENYLRHAMYKHSLFQRVTSRVEVKNIRSDHHQVYSQKFNKIGLSPFDDKRYVLHNGCDTRAHGHFLNMYQK